MDRLKSEKPIPTWKQPNTTKEENKIHAHDDGGKSYSSQDIPTLDRQPKKEKIEAGGIPVREEPFKEKIKSDDFTFTSPSSEPFPIQYHPFIFRQQNNRTYTEEQLIAERRKAFYAAGLMKGDSHVYPTIDDYENSFTKKLKTNDTKSN